MALGAREAQHMAQQAAFASLIIRVSMGTTKRESERAHESLACPRHSSAMRTIARLRSLRHRCGGACHEPNGDLNISSHPRLDSHLKSGTAKK